MRKMPGLDRALAEIFDSWGMLGSSTVHSLFYKTIAGKRRHTEQITGWSDWLLQALPKPHNELGELAHWRLEHLYCTLRNAYERLLWVAIPRAMAPLLPVQFGFVKGAQALAFTEYPQTLMRKASEWDHPLVIASLDVEKGFDQAEFNAVEKALDAHGARAWAIGDLSWRTLPNICRAGVAPWSPLQLSMVSLFIASSRSVGRRRCKSAWFPLQTATA